MKIEKTTEEIQRRIDEKLAESKAHVEAAMKCSTPEEVRKHATKADEALGYAEALLWVKR